MDVCLFQPSSAIAREKWLKSSLSLLFFPFTRIRDGLILEPANMSTLTLKPFIHRGMEQMTLFFATTATLNNCARKVKGIRWSKTHGCWYLPLNRENYGSLSRHDKLSLAFNSL